MHKFACSICLSIFVMVNMLPQQHIQPHSELSPKYVLYSVAANNVKHAEVFLFTFHQVFVIDCFKSLLFVELFLILAQVHHLVVRTNVACCTLLVVNLILSDGLQ